MFAFSQSNRNKMLLFSCFSVFFMGCLLFFTVLFQHLMARRRCRRARGAPASRPANLDVDRTQRVFRPPTFCSRGIRASPRSTPAMLASSGPCAQSRTLQKNWAHTHTIGNQKKKHEQIALRFRAQIGVQKTWRVHPRFFPVGEMWGVRHDVVCHDSRVNFASGANCVSQTESQCLGSRPVATTGGSHVFNGVKLLRGTDHFDENE